MSLDIRDIPETQFSRSKMEFHVRLKNAFPGGILRILDFLLLKQESVPERLLLLMMVDPLWVNTVYNICGLACILRLTRLNSWDSLTSKERSPHSMIWGPCPSEKFRFKLLQVGFSFLFPWVMKTHLNHCTIDDIAFLLHERFARNSLCSIRNPQLDQLLM